MQSYHYKTFLCIAALLTCFYCAQPEDEHVTKKSDVIIKYTKLDQIVSEIVDDTFYVYIRLPKHYEKSNKKYPVLYLLDGDITFPMATSIVRYLQYGKHVPEMIIVGIGYGTMMNDKDENMRARDYTPPRKEDTLEYGGANEYLQFIKEELIPYIDLNYRTDPKVRLISGHSLGGLFTIYTLFSEPGLFSHYIASSPYLSIDKDLLLSLEEQTYSKLNKIMSKVFISFGAEENRDNYILPINEIVNRIKSREYKALNLELRQFEGGSHFTCPPEAMTYGLVFAFSK